MSRAGRYQPLSDPPVPVDHVRGNAPVPRCSSSGPSSICPASRNTLSNETSGASVGGSAAAAAGGVGAHVIPQVEAVVAHVIPQGGAHVIPHRDRECGVAGVVLVV